MNRDQAFFLLGVVFSIACQAALVFIFGWPV